MEVDVVWGKLSVVKLSTPITKDFSFSDCDSETCESESDLVMVVLDAN